MRDHIERWLSQGYGADQIIRAAERMQSVDTLMELHLEDIAIDEAIKRVGERRRATDEADGWVEPLNEREE